MENPNEMTDPAEGRTVPDGDGAAALEPSPGVAPRSGEWTDEDIAKLRQMIGGKAELADGAIPAVLFVTANAIWGLVPGAIAAAAYGAAAVAYRLAKKQRVKNALIGLAGLGLSVGIALWTRNPNAYFAPGAAWGGLMGVLFLLTAAFRQPVSAVFAMALEQKPKEYYDRRDVLRMHLLVTTVWGLVFLGRALFRWYLMANGHTELLGASAVFLGYPVTAGLVAGSVLYLKRGARRLEDSEPEPPAA